MRKIHRISIGLLLACAACGRSSISDGDLITLSSHTPAIVNASQATGHINPEQSLRLNIAMPLRDQNGLDAFVADIYDPQSASFQAYLTPDTFAATYHPSPDSVAQVRAALMAAGIQPEDDAHGTLLGANATAAQAEAFFHTQIDTYIDPNGLAFYAPSTEVSVDKGLPISAAFGLHTPFPYTNNLRVNEANRNLATTAATTAAYIRAAYDIPATATGAGQVVGLYELDAYVASDIAAYCKLMNIKAAPLTNILVDGFSGTVQDAGAQGEVSLDIELVNAFMPNAKQLRVYETANGSGLDLFNEIANPTLGDKFLTPVISVSWGSAEDQSGKAELNSENSIFEQMAAQGQTVLAASGDSGAKADGSTVGVGDPASQPYVVGVGGTSLSTTNNVYASESAWSGGGGGISAAWPIPAWQKSAIVAGSQSSSTMRNVPDISADADPSTGFTIFVQGKAQSGVGGTSCAAPQWAGMMGLVNEARAQHGQAPMGFLSYALYLVGGSTQYGQAFHDIQSGNNGVYSAAKGFDNATGFGSFDGNNLIQVLSAGYARSTFGAPTGLQPVNP